MSLVITTCLEVNLINLREFALTINTNIVQYVLMCRFMHLTTFVIITMLYDDFKQLVDLILNNWTALQLAIEHGMGSSGPKTAQLVSDYVARYCVENSADIHDLTEVLEDLMDEEFDTVCEDNSPREVATVLLQYLALLKEGKREEIQARVAAMPVCQKGLSQKVSQPDQGDLGDSSSSGEDELEHTNVTAMHINGDIPALTQNQHPEPEPMDEDEEPGWTTVRSRRKR